MIRILHVVNSMGIGGIETFLMNVYRTIDKQQFQFDFLLHNVTNSPYENEIRQNGGILYYLPSRRDGIIKSRNKLDLFFNTHPEYKIVHEHVSSLSDIDALLCAQKHNVKGRIIHAHSTAAPGNKIHTFLHKMNKRKVHLAANYYYSCSDEATRWLYSDTGVIKNVVFIPNGINCNKFCFNEIVRNRTRERLGVFDKKVIIHIGRMSTEKNHFFLLDAFKKYNLSFPNSVLLLVGDGVLREQIKCKINELGIENSVMLLGIRQDIPELLMAADLFVLPSIFEGFPVSIIEAQATGIPCLYSKNITSTAKVTENTKQIEINHGSELWAKEIENMLGLGRDFDANRIITNSEFNIDNVTSKMCNTYKSILK